MKSVPIGTEHDCWCADLTVNEVQYRIALSEAVDGCLEATFGLWDMQEFGRGADLSSVHAALARLEPVTDELLALLDQLGVREDDDPPGEGPTQNPMCLHLRELLACRDRMFRLHRSVTGRRADWEQHEHLYGAPTEIAEQIAARVVWKRAKQRVHRAMRLT